MNFQCFYFAFCKLLRTEARFSARFVLKLVKFKELFRFGLGYMSLSISYNEQIDSENDSCEDDGDDTSRIGIDLSSTTRNQDEILS